MSQKIRLAIAGAGSRGVDSYAENNPALLLTSPEVSIESHLRAFAAERSRKNHTVEEIRL